MTLSRLTGCWLGLLSIAIPFTLRAEAVIPGESAARIAIIIDDLGNSLPTGKAVLALPGPVTCSILPYRPHSAELARLAHAQHKQVMLHLPMESHQGNRLGEGALTLEMPRSEFQRVLQAAIAAVPHVTGINNHMGSLLTRDPTAMRWMMSVMREQGLYFVDSRTSERTVAEKVAERHLIRSARRDIFLDNVVDKEKIREQFKKLIGLAKRNSRAIGIGHPHPATISVLAEELPGLQKYGVELVPASQLTHEGSSLWYVYSSPSPRGVKSLKPSPSPIF